MYSHLNENSRSAVADILYSMSMANGAEDPNNTVGSIGGMTCGIPTRTTPTLTPTTLKNIEESFLEFQSIPPAQLEHQHQAGFVTPVVAFPVLPTKHEDNSWMDDCMQSSDRSMESPGPPTSRSGKRSGGRRPNRDEKLSPEEEEKRRVRRERNKQAAARCRKRRMDHTNSLLQETEGLEEKRQNLQSEIRQLTCQKEELEFILDAHKTTCKINGTQLSQSKVRISNKSTTASKVKSYSRPNTMTLSPSFANALKNEFVSTSLNSNSGVYNFDTLMDSNEGGMPLVISSCSSQQRSSSSDLSSPDSVTPPKLVSL